MFQSTILVVLTCLASDTATASQANSELAKKVQSAAADLTTLTFVAEIKEVSTKIARSPALNREARLNVAMADGARFRVDAFQDDSLLATIVSDGAQVTEWDARKNLWTQYPLPEFDEKYNLKPLIVKDHLVRRFAHCWVDERGPFGPWMERLITDTMTSILAPQQVGEVLCDAVQYDRSELGIPFGYLHENHTFYFDQSTHLLKGEVKSVTGTSILLTKSASTKEIDYLDMRPNAKLPDDVFVFTPPPGATFADPSDRRFLRAVPAGESAPDLDLALIDGTTVTLRDVIKDKVALVSFWATWCPPCIQEMPALARLHDEFSAGGLAVVGVSRDSDIAMVKAFVGNRPMPYLQSHDAGGEGGEKYHFEAIPHTVLIDRAGKVVKTWQGWNGAEEEAEIRESIKKLIEDK